MIPSPALAALRLDDIQGNILKGHGRKYTALVFFRFGQRAEAAERHRRLLREAAAGTRPELAITSAAEQETQTARHRLSAAEQAEFRSLALSGGGLAACGFTAQTLGIAGELGSDQFWKGANPTMLGDQTAWDEGFAMVPDGVFLLAHNIETVRDRMATDAGRILREEYGVDGVVVEKAFRWMPKESTGDQTAHEHFGFADGFTRTNIIADPGSPLRGLLDRTMGFIRQSVRPFEIPLEQVMIGEPGPFLGASFLVVHKLEQNVRAFLQAERSLQAQLEATPVNFPPCEAGALFIGRERNGLPLATGARNRADPFHFGGDPEGQRCPFSAHIRKMNPRQNKMHGIPHVQSGRLEQKAAQFVRRGLLYGDEKQTRLDWARPEDAPADSVGLMFMGYMTKTGAQFLKMLINWGPSPDFPQKYSEADVLLGGSGKPWDWAQYPELVNPKPFNLGQFVSSKGAGFFVVPPLHWLKNIG